MANHWNEVDEGEEIKKHNGRCVVRTLTFLKTAVTEDELLRYFIASNHEPPHSDIRQELGQILADGVANGFIVRNGNTYGLPSLQNMFETDVPVKHFEQYGIKIDYASPKLLEVVLMNTMLNLSLLRLLMEMARQSSLIETLVDQNIDQEMRLENLEQRLRLFNPILVGVTRIVTEKYKHLSRSKELEKKLGSLSSTSVRRRCLV